MVSLPCNVDMVLFDILGFLMISHAFFSFFFLLARIVSIMSSRPFRSVVDKQYLNQVWRIAGLRCVSAPAGNIFVDGIVASETYIALPYESKGSILPLSSDFATYSNNNAPNVINAHPGKDIQDLVFSPHASNVLASISKDGGVLHVFELPPNGQLTANIDKPIAYVQSLSGATSIAAHPNVRGVFAVGCKEEIKIVSADYETWGNTTTLPAKPHKGKVLFTIPTKPGSGNDIVRVFWSYSGEFVEAIGRDGSVYIFPLAAQQNATTPVKSFTEKLGGMKNPLFLTILGEKNNAVPATGKQLVFVVGLGAARKPFYSLLSWDPKTDEFEVKVNSELAGLGPGQLLGHFDHDSQLFYFAHRAAQVAYVFDTAPIQEPTPNTAAFIPTLQVKIPSCTKGFGIFPKKICNVGENEIIQFASHTGSGLERFGISVLRRDQGFHPELYPPTFAGKAVLSVDDLAAGKVTKPAEFQIEEPDLY